jgi:hypothetical protein
MQAARFTLVLRFNPSARRLPGNPNPVYRLFPSFSGRDFFCVEWPFGICPACWLASRHSARFRSFADKLVPRPPNRKPSFIFFRYLLSFLAIASSPAQLSRYRQAAFAQLLFCLAEFLFARRACDGCQAFQRLDVTPCRSRAV